MTRARIAAATAALLLGASTICVAGEIVLAEKSAPIAKIDTAALLAKARAVAEKEAWGTPILGIGRVVFFLDRMDGACIAVELLMEAKGTREGKPVSERFSTVLWFDIKGDVYKNAEPAVLDHEVIPGNPMSSR